MPEEFSWMRIKGNHANGQATRCTGRTCIFNDLLMTPMDTIKIANRRNHVTMRQCGVTNGPGRCLNFALPETTSMVLNKRPRPDNQDEPPPRLFKRSKLSKGLDSDVLEYVLGDNQSKEVHHYGTFAC